MNGTPETRVVLLVGADGDAPQGAVLVSESTPLAALLRAPGETVAMDVITLGTSRVVAAGHRHLRLDDGARSPVDRALRAIGVFGLRDRLDTFPVGRLLNSIGPVAPSRVFWRTLRRNRDAVDLLRSADVAIASDLETTTTAWVALRRGWVGRAYYDHRALALALAQPARP